jgi:hypothetical protein
VPETTPEKVATSVPKTTPEGGSTSEPDQIVKYVFDKTIFVVFYIPNKIKIVSH